MNKAKCARWCNPLEGVQRKGDYDSGYHNFWAGGARRPPSMIYKTKK